MLFLIFLFIKVGENNFEKMKNFEKLYSQYSQYIANNNLLVPISVYMFYNTRVCISVLMTKLNAYLFAAFVQ